MRAVDAEQRAVAELLAAVDVAAERAERHRGAVAVELARRLRDEIDDAVHGVGAPHRRRRAADHFDLLQLVRIDRQQIPGDEAEEIEIEAAAVEQRQRRGRERRGGAAHRDVEVARRRLRDVDAGHRAEQLGVVGRRRRRDHVGGHDRHRRRRVDQLLLHLRRRDDDLFFVDRRFFGFRAGRLLRAGLSKCGGRCEREHQGRRERTS